MTLASDELRRLAAEDAAADKRLRWAIALGADVDRAFVNHKLAGDRRYRELEQLARDLASPSDQAMPTEPLDGWELAFAEDFAHVPDVPLGSFPEAMADRWWAYPWSATSPWLNTKPKGWGVYDPRRTISVHDGVMDLWPHTVPLAGPSPVPGAVNGLHLCACPVPLVPGCGFDRNGYPLGMLYGRFETRWRIPYAFDWWKLAWLLWPDSKLYLVDGEQDFPEGSTSGDLFGFMHHAPGKDGTDQEVLATGEPMAGRWRTTVIEWLPNSVRLLIDGVERAHWTERVPAKAMRLGYQTETGLRPELEPLAGSGGHVEIAHLRIHRPILAAA